LKAMNIDAPMSSGTSSPQPVWVGMLRVALMSWLLAGLVVTSSAAALGPPAPRVRAAGNVRSASVVTYCWAHAQSDGITAELCADGLLGVPAQSLPWRVGDVIYLDLRLPAHAVRVEAARLGAPGTAPRGSVRLRLRRLDMAGEHWAVVIPRRAQTSTALLISARFAEGDLFAAVGLHHRRSVAVRARASNDGNRAASVAGMANRLPR
jgi:hypothetical protein